MTELSEEEAYQNKLKKLNIPDIDKEDLQDPQACSEYVQNICEYLLQMEVLFFILKKFLIYLLLTCFFKKNIFIEKISAK